MPWNWTPPGSRLALAILVALAACGATPDDGDDAPVDAGLELDDARDAAPATCITAGDGSLYMQCCVWDATGCATDLACYWNDRPDSGSDDGHCYPPGSVAIGATCPLSANACVPGAFCAWDDDSPMTGTGTCRKLCNPASPACGASERCEVPFGDGTIGFCTGGAP